ncbi:MAG: CBS domain-containing protein [Planctomycetota bacterium]|nr:MAG: CBS domain-containing protein [Planctomycetota bacterium]REJ87734.1 MAG: CBS domain-containing protein [Planctomycetota bacterium]REK27817.1 MAG: CBS domain-containing protein [Planctomycetota bacterium]REK40271.1 MAG: CBS domain-containing protein [Planctomycetota bacterium]
MPAIKDIMTRAVEHVAGNATVQHAAERMAEKDIGFLAVSNGQTAEGVITDRDIVVRCLALHRDPEETTVHDCMTTDITTLSEEADVEEAGKMMEERQIRRLLVADSQGRLTGVVSLGDLATGCGDDHLRSKVLQSVSAE